MFDAMEINHVLVREVWNGAWFTLSAVMVVTLLAVVAHRICVLRKEGAPWYYDQALQVAVALVIFITGSCLRAGYIWFLLHCETFERDCAWIQGKSWVMSIAGVLAIVGGLCVIRVLSPDPWKPYAWMLSGIASLAIPAAYYFAS